MKLNKVTLLCIAAVTVTLILAVVSWFILPEQVGMQIGAAGQLQNFMPKPLALAMPVALSVLGLWLSMADRRRTAGLILSAVSPALLVFTVIVN